MVLTAFAFLGLKLASFARWRSTDANTAEDEQLAGSSSAAVTSSTSSSGPPPALPGDWLMLMAICGMPPWLMSITRELECLRLCAGLPGTRAGAAASGALVKWRPWLGLLGVAPLLEKPGACGDGGGKAVVFKVHRRASGSTGPERRLSRA